MSFRRIVLGMLVLWFSIMGVVCGVLGLLCLVLYVLWQGLGVSSVVLVVLCLFCLGLAVMLSGWSAANRERRDFTPKLRSVKSWWRSLVGSNSSLRS